MDDGRRRAAGRGILRCMVLKLAAGVPVVWRTPQSVQLGVQRPLVVLDDVSVGHERMLAALVAGVSPSGWQMLASEAGLDAAEAGALLAALSPALEQPVPLPAATGRVLVVGDTALGREIAAQLADTGRLTSPDADDEPTLVVLVADWVVSPDDHGAWLRRDIAHLPVVASDGGVTIGPFVEPGQGPCLYCLHLARADADPAWPAIATQLWGRPAPPQTRTALAAAAAFTARRVSARLDDGPGDAISWQLVDDGTTVSAQQRLRHPACSCGALPESDWAPDVGRENPRVTTTSTAVAVPA